MAESVTSAMYRLVTTASAGCTRPFALSPVVPGMQRRALRELSVGLRFLPLVCHFNAIIVFVDIIRRPVSV
jgi:hypothetical protein